MKNYIIIGLTLLCSILFGLVLGITVTPNTAVLDMQTIVTPTAKPTLISYPTFTPTPFIQRQVYRPAVIAPTSTPVPIESDQEQLMDCYRKSDAGYILYDFGKVSVQKCKDLANDWWTRKNDDLKYSNQKFCMDSAKNQASSCTFNCSGLDDVCYSNCDKTFQESLAKCTQ